MTDLNELLGKFRKKLDTPEAAEYLGLGKSTLDKLRAAGCGPTFIKIGKRVVYDPADLDVWFASHKRTSISDSVAQPAGVVRELRDV